MDYTDYTDLQIGIKFVGRVDKFGVTAYTVCMAYKDKQPKFEKGIRSGYHVRKGSDYGTWRFREGHRGTKRRVLNARDQEQALFMDESGALFGAVVNMRDMTPVSNVLEEMESVLQGVSIERVVELAKSRKPDPMPADIRAMMRLSDLYCRTEGDIFQLFEIPMDLSLREVEIECPDKGLKRSLEEIYDADTGIDIDECLYQIWLTSSIYGQAFPLEVWDGNTLTWIVHLNPTYVKVGIGMGGYALGLSNEGESWSDRAIQSQIPPMAYKSFAPGWNEVALNGDDIPILKEYCHAVREKSLAFQRYALPPLSRAFRAIGTRRIMEEMLRATMEGYRNQLWLFLLGDPEHQPSVPHITALQTTVNAMVGQRTGAMVWWNAPLDVQTHAPESFGDLKDAGETYVLFTRHIYQQLGIHPRLTSGEGSGGQIGGGGGAELDVRILLERTKFKRKRVVRWERHLRMNIGRKMLGGSKTTMENLSKTLVRFARSPLEIEREVSEVLLPIYAAGGLSDGTLLGSAGFSYEIELQKKQEEEKNAHLFTPKPTYSQTTVKPGTEPSESGSTPQGRPPEGEKASGNGRVQASFLDEPVFDEMLRTVYQSFSEMLSGKIDVPGFVGGLVETVETSAMEFGRQGYLAAGGAGTVNPDWIKGASDFVNSFAGGLQTDLEAASNPESLYWRVYLYPQEVRHLSWMYGVQQAMKERGAKAWRRILHPELSETGPCEACVLDSAVVHPITLPFFEFHPNGVCSVQGVAYYTDVHMPILEVPIPGKVTLPERIREIVERLGKIGKAIIRRIRI